MSDGGALKPAERIQQAIEKGRLSRIGKELLALPDRDDEYDLIQPRKIVKGRQCGLCWMKFDYDTVYGYYCTQTGCPMGFGFDEPGNRPSTP